MSEVNRGPNLAVGPLVVDRERGDAMLVARDGGFAAIVGATGPTIEDWLSLLCAAPDMRDALKAVLDSDMAMREEDEGRKSTTLKLVRAALAKAEGRS